MIAGADETKLGTPGVDGPQWNGGPDKPKQAKDGMGWDE